MIKLKSLNGFVAVNLIVMAWSIFLMVVVFERGGGNALFAIIGHISGWVGAVVYFLFRKPPTQ